MRGFEMRRLIREAALTLVVCALTGGFPAILVAHADSTSAAAPTAKMETRTYVEKAADADLFEIESSKLALQKSTTSDVRSFAQMMIKDHTASTEKLKATLKKEKMDAPPATLDPQHQAQLDRLKAEASTGFDNAYIKAQLQGHQDALSLHQDYAANGADKGLKAFAAKTEKIVQMHLDHVEALAKKKNVSG
jgi:putative membrane protein